MKTGGKVTRKVLAFVLVAVLTVGMVQSVFAAERSPATATIYIDGQATNLGAEMFAENGFRFVCARTFSETTGFPIVDEYEKANPDGTMGRSVYFHLTDSYQPARFRPSQFSVYMRFSYNRWSEFERNGQFLRVDYGSKVYISDGGWEGRSSYRCTWGVFPEGCNEVWRGDDCPGAKYVNGKMFLPLEIICWMLHWRITVDGNVIRVNTTLRNQSIRPRTSVGTATPAVPVPIPAQATEQPPTTETPLAVTEQTTVYIDGQATNLGDILIDSEGHLYVSGEAFSEVFGFEFFENVGYIRNSERIVLYVSANFLVVLGEYSVVERDNSSFAISASSGVDLPHAVEHNGEWFISLDIAAALLDFDMTYDGNAVRLSTANSSISPRIGVLTQPATVEAKTIVLTIGSTTYTVNGVSHTSDAAPFIADNRTMIPIRLVSEALGAEVDWIAEHMAVVITSINHAHALILDEPLPNNMGTPVSVGGRTFVPVAYVAEMLGAAVRWDGSTQTVTITTPAKDVSPVRIIANEQEIVHRNANPYFVVDGMLVPITDYDVLNLLERVERFLQDSNQRSGVPFVGTVFAHKPDEPGLDYWSFWQSPIRTPEQVAASRATRAAHDGFFRRMAEGAIARANAETDVERLRAIYNFVVIGFGDVRHNREPIDTTHRPSTEQVGQIQATSRSSIAFDLLRWGHGQCHNFAVLFTVMAQESGFDALTAEGQYHNRDGTSVTHTWSKITLNDRLYVFDPHLDMLRSTGQGRSADNITYEWFMQPWEDELTQSRYTWTRTH